MKGLINLPNYIYKCTCGNEIIINRKMSEYSPTTLCNCGKVAERKVEDLVANYLDIEGFYGKKSK